MSPGPDPRSLGSRLDRLPWSGRHTAILLALGAGWLFDSLEVQLFSSAVGPLGDHFGASVTARDAVLAVWLVGILLGALLGGPLTDRFGRRRLFVATPIWYAGFTVLTGLAPTLGGVYLLRFAAALGVGAEYAIVNTAIAEFMPARVRGRANAAVMNFWPAGAILGALLAYLILDVAAPGAAASWRYMFVLGGLLALVVLVFRRRVPESPRWLASRGRHSEADAVVSRLEAAGGQRPEREQVPTTEPAPLPRRAALGDLLRRYPGRAALGALLDLAEAFGYYGLFALLSVVVLPQVHISQRQIPFCYIVGNVGALASYSAAAAGVVLLATATATGSSGWVTGAFVVASAAASAAWTSAYPTFTELFPTHLRGAGVGAPVAAGRVGAIVGTLLLTSAAISLGASASYGLVAAFWLVGVAMAGFSARGGPEAACLRLESLAPPVSAAAA